MNSSLLRLNVQDFAKGLVVAVLAALFTYGAAMLNTPGFAIATLDWHEVIRIAVASGFAYLAKNFISDNEGRVLGGFYRKY
jgi:hypothetical protein